MNPLLANVIGVIGSVLFMGAFVYANRVEQIDKLLFNAVNLVGAVLLLISLSVHFNLAAVVLETAWALIALAGIVKALRERRGTAK
ncbi:hypothetical protein [Blastomonas sp. AAP53]|uniref:CBU_0592 family membrane protein n=1 Tax=Blastomonas sp. AAP53 TaxID=1248760 RepID=UPI0002F70E7A|nr:hypothetical protein [Blastomonas sp. AAP53]